MSSFTYLDLKNPFEAGYLGQKVIGVSGAAAPVAIAKIVGNPAVAAGDMLVI